MPVPRELHVDQFLTNVAVAFWQDQRKYIADKVFPIVPVAKQSDKYPVYPRGYFFRDDVAPRPLGGRAPLVDYKVQSDTYVAEEYALGHNLDDRARANYDQPLDPDRAAARLLTQQFLIHRDRLWVSKYFTTSVWSKDRAGVASNPTGDQFLQFDQTGSDPIGLVDAERDRIAQATGFEPNALVMGRAVYRVLKEHPKITDKIKYTQRGIVTPDLLAQVFGVERVLIPSAVYNAAAEGATDSMQFIVNPKSMLLVYAAPNPSLDEPSGGYTFAWTGLIPGAVGAFGGVIQRGRDELAHSDYFEIRGAYDMKLVAADLGTFFTSCVA